MAKKYDEEYDDEFLETGKKRRLGLKIFKKTTLIILIIGIIIGLALGHYIAEPIIRGQAFSKTASCESKVDLLESQVNSCLADKSECETNLQACETG